MPDIADFGTGYWIHVTGLIHDETGFPSGSPAVTRKAIDRLHQKIMIAKDEVVKTESLLLDAARTAYQAVLDARRRGVKIGMLRLRTIWPFAAEAVYEVARKVKGILVPELNYGQLVGEIERAAKGACPVELLAKYNAEIFTPAEIEEAIMAMVGGNK